MFIYLSKKISIPSSTKLSSISWSSNHGWIAIGGEDGLLKILKLDAEKKDNKGIENLSMNQTLRGHSNNVHIVVWNEHYQKLTSSDSNGVITVWTLNKGNWYEEMINKNKCDVRGISWNSDGQKICIVYEDGLIIVGSVDGSRIWSKELKKTILTGVKWSPNSKYLLFTIQNGEVHVYDDQGIFMNKVNIVCLPSVQVTIQISGICWYDGKNGYVSPDCPKLAIVYQSGHIQLMRDMFDNNPIVLDTNMFISDCHWNATGSILGIVGSTVLTGDNKDSNIIQFFSPFGKSVRSLKLPGETVSSFSWEGDSLRLALTIDSCVYFANIRPGYSCCYFSETIVYSFYDINKNSTIVNFWDTKNNKCYQKAVTSLISLAACNDHCVLAVLSETASQQYTLMVCSSVGAVTDYKHMDMKPMWVTMNSTHVFAASNDNFLMWQYTTPKFATSAIRFTGSRYRKERVYHIDDTPSGVAELTKDLDKSFESTEDRICCLTCSERTLLIGRKSGTIQRYALPQVALIQRLHVNNNPCSISVNCNSSKISVIDCTSTLHLITIDKEEPNETVKEIGESSRSGRKKIADNNESTQTKRQDVWAMKWASDNPSLLAIMEKTKLTVLQANVAEDPINSSAYIADFKDLEIKSVWLDDVMKSPNNPRPSFIVNYETKSLRNLRQILQKHGITEAIQFIEHNPHKKFWKVLAEHAVRTLDLTNAESAYARCNDYIGIQLVKRLNNIQNDQLKRAQIAAYFNNYDEAEHLYLKADRRDLAITLREKLGDWFRVIELIKSGSISSDSLLIKAYNNIGDSFAEQNMWESAKDYYQKAGNSEKLITCYAFLEDYKELGMCISSLPEGNTELEKVAELFFSAGMCSEAVSAYLKFGSYQSAIDVCIKLKNWNQALEISNQFATNVPVMELIEKEITKYVEKGSFLDAIQLYKCAEKYLEAAELLTEIAKKEQMENSKPLVLKKLYVLVALLVEEHINSLKSTRLKSAGAYSKAVIGLSVSSSQNMKLLDNCWHGAEAYHLLMLAQRQLMFGSSFAALTCAVTLKDYDDVLPAEKIYCIIATTAIACTAFDIASRAFTELESLDTTLAEQYENIALTIFSKNIPKDPPEISYRCGACSTVTSLWNRECPNCKNPRMLCVACGKIIDNLPEAWTCNVCKHSICYTEIASILNCPLCHSSLK